MSFEGFYQRLCATGHLHEDDVYAEGSAKVCPRCQAPFVWENLVDQTNGYYEDDPSTYRHPLEVDGWDDEWRTDHYGNKYAVKILKYKIPVQLSDRTP